MKFKSRQMTHREIQLVGALLSQARFDLSVAENWPRWKVVELSDGGMGSFRFDRSRVVGQLRKASEVEFLDQDGVYVSVALLVDQENQPSEVDVFKADFSEVQRLPDSWGA